MEKMKMCSSDLTLENIEKIAKLFPNVITESKDETGILKKAVDFDLLKQELSNEIIESEKERYQLTWPGKKEAIVTANTPINKTLRPVKDDSVDWDKTQNIYIEGDNLEALKILQEGYLNKIKCIYIDPPYNTGKDFVYKDNFSQDKTEYNEESGQIDEEGNRLFQNNESNGRFHSDWLTMMYSRLKLARNLLSEDGVIFINIDENEICNLHKLNDEIFGTQNFAGNFIWINRTNPNDAKINLAQSHEYILCYSKNITNVMFNGIKKDLSNYKNLDNDPNGPWIPDNPSAASGSDKDRFPIVNPYTSQKYFPPQGRYWAFSQKRIDEWFKSGKLVFPKENNKNFLLKKYLFELKSEKKPLGSIIQDVLTMHGTKEIRDIFYDALNTFDYPKPTKLVKYLIEQITQKNDIILDFFSGSATTAHAVMQLNAEDGGNRKYIMVQLPEKTSEDSEAYKAGYKNICEIGKERIRRAAKKIQEETNADIDYGFRVFKVDSSNMKDVYYTPEHLKQNELELFESNIKDDRNGEDLLIQVMLDFGLELSLPLETKKINGNIIHFAAGNSLAACFDEKISESAIKNIAKEKPLRVVFRDSSFKDDAARINVEEIFKMLSPATEIKVI